MPVHALLMSSQILQFSDGLLLLLFNLFFICTPYLASFHLRIVKDLMLEASASLLKLLCNFIVPSLGSNTQRKKKKYPRL